jgi:hypothetical protein
MKPVDLCISPIYLLAPYNLCFFFVTAEVALSHWDMHFSVFRKVKNNARAWICKDIDIKSFYELFIPSRKSPLFFSLRGFVSTVPFFEYRIRQVAVTYSFPCQSSSVIATFHNTIMTILSVVNASRLPSEKSLRNRFLLKFLSLVYW